MKQYSTIPHHILKLPLIAVVFVFYQEASPFMTQLFHKTAGELMFQPFNAYNMKGPYLAGSTVEESTSHLRGIRIQYWTGKELSLEHRWFNFSSNEILEAVISSSSLRLEILLSGFFNINFNNQHWTSVQAGNYWFSEKTRTTFKFDQSVAPQMLVAYLPSSWIQQLVKSGDSFELEKPYPLVPSMFTVLDDLMHHGYTSNLYEVFYEKCCKDLIFYHLLYNGYKYQHWHPLLNHIPYATGWYPVCNDRPACPWSVVQHPHCAGSR